MSIRRRIKSLAVDQEITIKYWSKYQPDKILIVSVNPSKNDLARLLQANQKKGLRILDNKKDFVAWPANAALHYQVAQAMLQMRFKSSRSWAINLDENGQFKVGRFIVDVYRTIGQLKKVALEKMSPPLLRALGR
ncbi:MAG TPA: hypothetical protein VNX68_14145 [Nitrosopumilaceae archaeon]|jgi:hypothetical protein|nr:hypothetical protein [Nitrosopumilaceae archaeon]